MQDRFADHQIKSHDPRHRFRGQPIISDQISREGLETVILQLEHTLQRDVPGAVVEFGCYIGTTSLFIRRVLDKAEQSAGREFHVYDSFAGLPPKTSRDHNAAGVDFTAGKLYVSKKELLGQFRSAGLQPPVIHKGWFHELDADAVPAQIAFAFLDGDFYGSIISSLRLVWPRMAPGGCLVIDDYNRETLPGVARAVHDFFRDKQLQPPRVSHHKAIIGVPRRTSRKKHEDMVW